MIEYSDWIRTDDFTIRVEVKIVDGTIRDLQLSHVVGDNKAAVVKLDELKKLAIGKSAAEWTEIVAAQEKNKRPHPMDGQGWVKDGEQFPKCPLIPKGNNLATLANEIERRELKFADVVDGQYEMLSSDELSAVVKALRDAAAKGK